MKTAADRNAKRMKAAAAAAGNGDEPPRPPDDLAGLLDDVATFVHRFIVMSDHQADAVTLFAAHTHAVDAFDVVAYLFITSATRRCGKSLLEDILEDLCHIGRSTTNISPAALYRMVDTIHPTLLFDEVDNIFVTRRNSDPAKGDLIGLINAGYRRGRPAYRMGGPNMRTLEAFDPFGPKVLAGLGGCLPDTVEDRCIKIRLQRKGKAAKVERFRLRVHAEQAKALGEQLLTIAALAETLRVVWPELPDALDDRAQDIWEPLLAIADAAGGTWPTRARTAALTLNAERADATEPESIELLADLRRVFDGSERMFSQTIVEQLNALEETQWSGWHRGDGFRTFDLARLLRDFAIKSKDVRIGIEVRKGYVVDDFTAVWNQYLPRRPTRYKRYRGNTPGQACCGCCGCSGTGARGRRILLGARLRAHRNRRQRPLLEPRRYNGRPAVKRRCAGCHAVIDGHGNRRFCSGACQERAYRRAKSSTKNVPVSGPVPTVIRGTNGVLIAAVARLGYLGGPDDPVLDLTYGQGKWWTRRRPRVLIRPELDFRNQPMPDDSMPFECFDPPYISTGNRDTSTVDEFYARYGLGELKGWKAIRALIDDGLAECARVLAPGGYLLVKCMNYTESGEKVFNIFHVFNQAELLGLRPVDWFIHWTGGGPQPKTNRDGSPREQQHAREAASILLVFTK